MSTDCGIPNTPHENLAQAMQVIDELADLGPVASLKLATSTSARLLYLDDRGTIAAGQRADLLVVEGDPTILRQAWLERVVPVLSEAGLEELAAEFEANVDLDWSDWDPDRRRVGSGGPDDETLARIRGDKNRSMLMD